MKNRLLIISSPKLIITGLLLCLLLQQQFQTIKGYAANNRLTSFTATITRNHQHQHPAFDRRFHHTFVSSKQQQEQQQKLLHPRYTTFSCCWTRRLSSTSPIEELAAETPIEPYGDDDDIDDPIQLQRLTPTTSAKTNFKRPELWLDLRGTALSPVEAMDHLQELLLLNDDANRQYYAHPQQQHADDDDDDDDDDQDRLQSHQPLVLSWIDRVIVSPEKIASHRYDDDDDNVYYVTDDHDAAAGEYQLLVQSRNNQSFPMGKVISIHDNDDSDNAPKRRQMQDDASLYWKLNPLLAMETVSAGQWYWVDCQGGGWDKPSCTPALTSLVDMITLAATADATSSPESNASPWLGLFESSSISSSSSSTTTTVPSSSSSLNDIGNTMDHDKEFTIDTSNTVQASMSGAMGKKNGGLALTCPTPDALWQAASLFVQHNQQGRSEMTKSGILIPTTTIATTSLVTLTTSDPLPPTTTTHQTPNETTQVEPTITRKATTGSKVISLALVLPFDAGLWKTAGALLTTNNNE